MFWSEAAQDVYLGFAAFFTGIGLTVLFYHCARRTPGAQATPPEPDLQPSTNDSSRAQMAIQQLHDVALHVASDVNAHKTIVGQISDRLAVPASSSEAQQALIAQAAGELLQANATLQSRLEIAEMRIQAQAQEIQAQQTAAETDALTGLANRRAFDAAMRGCLEKLEREAAPFSVVMFDVDHFKQLNDTHGHLAGDEVLRSIGRLLPTVVKSGDVACRYGGEEFALVLRGANILDAQQVSQRVRLAIESLTVVWQHKRLQVTASLGAAEGTAGEQALGIVRRADDCVYASKRAGRNRCHWHNGQECVPLDAQPTRAYSGRKPSAASAANQRTADPVLPLKSLPGRTLLLESLKHTIAENQRTGQPLTVVHLKVKEFDAIKPQHGAAAEEQALAHVAQGVASALRDTDGLGVWLPGEFTVVLPLCTESGARIVTQRLLASAPANIRLESGERLPLELAAGIAAVEPGENAEQLVARARRASGAGADAAPATLAAVE